MGTLFISFLVAVAGAVCLVVISKTFDLDVYSARVFPLVPILYAIVYEMLEKRRSGRSRPIPPAQAREELKAGAAALFEHITAGRIAGDVGIAFLIKFGLEGLLTVAYLAVARLSFEQVYGSFGIATLSRILRGDHPWLGEHQSIALLALIAVTASLGTGLWIGSTTRGNAILEGVLAGAAVMVVTSLTNLLSLYRAIEDLTVQAAESMGYATHFGFVVVIALQVLLYGLWSGMACREKTARAVRAAEKKAKKAKK